MIIGIVSLAGAGKDTFADYLVLKYDFRKINTSDAISEILKEKDLEDNKDNRSIIADQWRKETGRMDIVTFKSLEKIKDPKNLVIIGFRSLEESELMKKMFPSAILISLIANPKIRYSRKRMGDPQDRAGFFGRDERDINKKGLAKVIMSADYFILNNSSLEDFYKKIDKFMIGMK
ncbi:MAG: AAA family ATPase [Nanoarchaeota archaeon]|nr:AAA family ATPase [Nanoarchaeota archaeon]